MDQDNVENNELEIVDPANIMIRYSIRSILGGMENNRYKQEIKGEIFHVDIEDNELAKIGTVYADKLLMDIAINDGWTLYEVCDIGEALYEIGNDVYDFNNNDWRDSLDERLSYTLIGKPLLILNKVDILPGYDVLEIGKHVIKDLYNNFSSGESLFVIICFPLHSKKVNKEASPEWKLDTSKNWKMIRTFPNTFKNLVKFYKGLGFKYFPKISADLMFMSTSDTNPGFDKIILD